MKPKENKDKRKYLFSEIGELVLLLGNPLPSYYFVRCDADKRQWWLQVENYNLIYYTTINLTKWRAMAKVTKYKYINIANNNLHNRAYPNTPLNL